MRIARYPQSGDIVATVPSRSRPCSLMGSRPSYFHYSLSAAFGEAGRGEVVSFTHFFMSQGWYSVQM